MKLAFCAGNNHDALTGLPLWQEIGDAISRFDKLLLIASRASLTSGAVLREIELALRKGEDLRSETHDRRGVTVIPIYFDNFLLHEWTHPLRDGVTDLVCADARRWEDESIFFALLDKLLVDLRRGGAAVTGSELSLTVAGGVVLSLDDPDDV